jgi:hypothetical protein
MSGSNRLPTVLTASCSLDDGVNEYDLMGQGQREPLRTLCTRLACRLWAACRAAGFGEPSDLQVNLLEEPHLSTSNECLVSCAHT